ncbi:YqiA/YcfP family alpha/beta fold hydrolase [Spiribacter roseus]|uniref:YqiA/YcfP family alpha/beta fold hydrolase n=1 Tax=Spiribacter roseus TaxID=1855875 RepID=A0ABV3RY35_9GAMM
MQSPRDSMITLNYLHGFNSAALETDTKVGELATRFGVHRINYDSFAPRASIIESIAAQSVEGDTTAFIGTSLGGYFAAVMGQRLACPAIMVNPSCDPHWALAHYRGMTLENYKLPDQPPQTLTSAAIDSYRDTALSTDPADYPVPPLLVLDTGDELLDARATHKRYASLGAALVFEGGSHRFEHMPEALDGIEAYLSRSARSAS